MQGALAQPPNLGQTLQAITQAENNQTRGDAGERKTVDLVLRDEYALNRQVQRRKFVGRNGQISQALYRKPAIQYSKANLQPFRNESKPLLEVLRPDCGRPQRLCRKDDIQ